MVWWLMPRTPDPEVGGSSPTRVKPCCVLEQGTFTIPINKLMQLKKSKHIKKYWSYDGKIYAKAHENQPKWRITKIEDIPEMITSAIEEGFIQEPESDADGEMYTDTYPGATNGATGEPRDATSID